MIALAPKYQSRETRWIHTLYHAALHHKSTCLRADCKTSLSTIQDIAEYLYSIRDYTTAEENLYIIYIIDEMRKLR